MKLNTIEQIKGLEITDRISSLKKKMMDEPRFLSIEQALLITECYKNNENIPRNLQRAKCLDVALEKINIKIDPDELIVGNRTPEVRAGVISPEAGISWVDKEIETLSTRPQDKFNVRSENIDSFRKIILPYWRGKSLEDKVGEMLGEEISKIGKVVKINQTDHAQGHICPDTQRWLKFGPAGLKKEALKKMENSNDKKGFYEGIIIVLGASQKFIRRYGKLVSQMAAEVQNLNQKNNLNEVNRICYKIADNPPDTFHEAVQSMWFLYVILQMESNASSFSPGRADQYLYQYFIKDYESGNLPLSKALEIIEALWLKFNQIVYLRNSNSAKYFAGFPIGFNIACGGQTLDGKDASNELSFLFLKAQEHVRLPQPNLSVRLFKKSSNSFVEECSRIIGLGSGMPQIFNDESIVPTLENKGVSHEDAVNYAIVGCVELTTHGNNLGWSDAAMFNMVKALELTLNNGICLLTGKEMGLKLGYLTDYKTFNDLEKGFKKQIDHFIKRMIAACEVVDTLHAEVLPSPFLSSVIDDCIEKGIDVTEGGAHYNLSGIQAIQVANIADSLTVIKRCIYEDQNITAEELLKAIQTNYEEREDLRQWVINKVPKYGNDIDYVDNLGNKWVDYFAKKLTHYTNARGGIYHMGLYTVSAHMPKGQNVGASADGRKAKDPLADGGMSAMYGRDQNGPTALLKSVSKIKSINGSNGTLLNMKFQPELFRTSKGIKVFSALLRTFVDLHINHVQFNVIRKEDLIAAKNNPEDYKSLIVRVAGYSAYFTELANDLQDEIITRTTHGDA